MDIKIPNLGEGADSGTVVSIYVKEGDAVKKDQTLVELENEKAVAPIPSTQDGVVTKILVKVGDKVHVGQSIVSLAGGASSGPENAAKSVPAASAPRPAGAPMTDTARYEYLTPSVRKRARELGMDPLQYAQSRPGGFAPPPPAESIDFSKWGPVQKKAVSSLRQKIAQKMTESWTTIPHVTQFEDVDITALMDLRKKYVAAYEAKGAKLTLTSFILKACVTALKKHPVFNASLDENTQEVVYKEYHHLGVAVDTEQGLIVPVLKDADKKDLLKLSKELEELAEKTRARKVSIDDLKGGTFTISNLGGIGGGYFTPIINKPEVAILGVSKGKKNAAGRLIMPIGVSYDHRVIDGADGARFVRTLAEALEQFPEKDIQI
jgi:pyruvate dehydrogenase E2 component (dihydrolipoamide acetyltransferase)